MTNSLLGSLLLFMMLIALGCAPLEEDPPEPELAVSAHGSALTLPADLVENGDFESGTSATDTVVRAPWSGDAQTTIEWGGEAYRNRRNALIQADTGWHSIQQTIPVKPSTRYRASGLFRTSPDVNDGYFTATRVVRPRTGGKIVGKTLGKSFPGADQPVKSIFEVANQIHFTAPMPEYTYLSFEFDTGNATSVVLDAGYWAPGSGSWLRIDSISVHEVENRVNNGGFESALAGWEAGGGSITTGTGLAGASSAIVQGTTGWNVVQQWVQVRRATEYRVGGWFRTSPTVGDIYFSVRGNVTFDVIDQLHLGAMSAGWEYRSFTFNSGDSDWVLLYAGHWAPGVTSWIEVDDISITETADLNIRKCIEDNYRIVKVWGGRTTNAVPTAVIGDKLALFVELQREPQPGSEENRMKVNGEKSSWIVPFDASGHAWAPFWSATPVGASSPRSYTVSFPTVCGTLTREVTVDIVSPTAPPNSISASPASISSGGSSTLTWSVSSATPARTQCLEFTSRLIGKRVSDGVVVATETFPSWNTAGMKVVGPSETTDYLMVTTCDNSPWLQTVSTARVAVSAPPGGGTGGGGGAGGGGSTCFEGTAGASSVTLVNQTAFDTLSIWRKDLASGIYSYIDDIGPGSLSEVSLPNCQWSEVIAVSHEAVNEWNARFGASYDPHSAAAAQQNEFRRWLHGPILGRDDGPILVDLIQQ